MEFVILLKEVSILESSKIAYLMVKVLIITLTKTGMKESGKITKEINMEFFI
jgi:hypothetical protein